MFYFFDTKFTPSSEHPNVMGQKNTQVLFWFDVSGYYVLFRECVEGFLGSYWILEFCFQQAFSSHGLESSAWWPGAGIQHHVPLMKWGQMGQTRQEPDNWLINISKW